MLTCANAKKRTREVEPKLKQIWQNMKAQCHLVKKENDHDISLSRCGTHVETLKLFAETGQTIITLLKLVELIHEQRTNC